MNVLNAGVQLFDMCAKPAVATLTKSAAPVQTRVRSGYVPVPIAA